MTLMTLNVTHTQKNQSMLPVQYFSSVRNNSSREFQMENFLYI